MNAKRQALVIGANGVIGRRLIEELTGQGWPVVGVSRRGGEPAHGVRHLQVDLLDAEATRDALRPLSAISHVFYAAYQDAPDWAGRWRPICRCCNTSSRGWSRSRRRWSISA